MKPYDVKQPPPKGAHQERIAGESGQWGNLPPRLREDMMQQAQLRFLQEYETRLRAYYKLLGADE
ncbi:MAG: hypothetical protein AAB434_07260 [Planctomycetota bacterium]